MASLIGDIRRIAMRAPVPLSPRYALSTLPIVGDDTSDAAKLNTYDQSPDVFAVVDRNAEAFAAVEWTLYRKRDGRGRVAGGERRQVTSHAALDTLERPNEFLSGHDLRWLWSATIDLTGKSHWVQVLSGARGRSGFPVELWPVSPHLMSPVADPGLFMKGWLYRAPDGQPVPLELAQVVHSRRPHPKDPYGASSPIGPLMVDIDAARQASRYNAAFFHNSAQPGGIIEFPEGISDEHWEEFVTRWEEQHRGVHNAHRVATIERGKWVERATSMRDMEFGELRMHNRQTLLAGFGFPKTMLGQTEDVNRATSLTAKEVHAESITLPKLRRFKLMLNRFFLPQFAGGDGLEFDHADPSPMDEEAEDQHREKVASTAIMLAGSGYDPDEIAEWMESEGLPRFTWVGWPDAPDLPDVDVGPPQDGPNDPDAIPDELLDRAGARPRAGHGRRHWPRAQDDDDQEDDLPGVQHLQDSWEGRLEELLAAWTDAEDEQKAAIVAALVVILREQGIRGLDDLDVDSTATAELLTDAMVDIEAEASEQVVDEAAEQGVDIETVEPDRELLRNVALGVAAILAGRLIASAKATTLRVWREPEAGAEEQVIGETVTSVADALRDLSAATPRSQLGGALTGAQNEGRLATIDAARPVGDVYASEVNDSNTCGPCREIDGRLLGTTDDVDQIRQSYPAAGFGGYVDCLGRERCRGTIVIRWREP